MAMSMLHEAQTRNLAAALAHMKREEAERREHSLSPPSSVASSAGTMYSGLQHAASAFSLFSPTQIFAANRQAAAAAFLSSQLPSLATSLFPPHPALLPPWSTSPLQLGNNAAPHSPPVSPCSPISTAVSAPPPSTPPTAPKHSYGMLSPTRSANSGLEPSHKRVRRMSPKKELRTPPMDMPLNVSDLYSPPSGPISPPSSGSSPNSTHELLHSGVAVTGSSNLPPTGPTSTPRDPSRDKSFTCKICLRSFGYKHVLQNHERTHTGEKPFECPECHKRFTRDHHLKTHMRLHTGEKPYHCSHCDRQFVQVANLRRHLRVHTGERPYTCDICQGKFSDSNQLKSHLLVHNGEKPFECERCHMKFRRRHHVMNHKCGRPSPPRSPDAAIPATTHDFGSLGEQKFALGPSYDSVDSLEMGRPSNVSASSFELERSTSTTNDDSPLDLSEDAANNNNEHARKSNDIRRIFRTPALQILRVHSEIPEQTEPEDLSVRASGHSLLTQQLLRQVVIAPAESPESMDHDMVGISELDEAATLYMRQQQQFAQAFKQHAIKME